jgi:hypothetical protein
MFHDGAHVRRSLALIVLTYSAECRKIDRRSFLALSADGSGYSLTLCMTLYHTSILLMVGSMSIDGGHLIADTDGAGGISVIDVIALRI